MNRGRPLLLRAAPFWRRGLAALADVAIVALLLTGIGATGLLSGDLQPALGLPWIDQLADLLLQRWPLLLRWAVLALGVAGAYVVVCHGLFGRSGGDWLCGLRLVGPDGAPPHPLRALLRAVLVPLTLLPCGAGFWWALADRQRRALYDRLAGTHLVRGEAEGGADSQAASGGPAAGGSGA